MPDPTPLRYVARITLEAELPLLLASGEDPEWYDAAFVRDANGLPAIPGTSLAGALRAAVRRQSGEAQADELFGYQKQKEGRGSRLSISWAHVHDQSDRPVDGLRHEGLGDDPVLRQALAGVPRDHVRLGEHGTADAQGSGLYRELAVARGHRFTFEMMLEGSEDDRDAWTRLRDLILKGDLRLGGKTRRGFGRFACVRWRQGVFDLRKGDAPDGATGFLAVGTRLDGETGLAPIDVPEHEADPTQGLHAKMQLEPEGLWLFGGGSAPDELAGERAPDRAPVSEPVIEWTDDGGSVREHQLLVPASSVKGALRHRVLFHAHRLRGAYAEMEREDPGAFAEHSALAHADLVELFGSAKGADGGKEQPGRVVLKEQPGRVVLDDLHLDDPALDGAHTKRVQHNALDRFTGGTRHGLLFDELALRGAGVRIPFTLTVREPEKVSGDARAALGHALEDLAAGRLQLGAGSGRGHGFFHAPDGVSWTDGGNWVQEADS